MSRLKTQESAFVAQVNVMVAKMSPSTLALAGVSTNSWDAAENSFTGFKTAIDVTNQAKDSWLAASSGKKASYSTTRAQLQSIVDKFYATPAITNEMLNDIGLPSRSSGGTTSYPVPVTNLVATASPNGTCLLKWKRNGNSRTTLFEIQASNGSGWVTINSTTRLTFTDPAATPGIPKYYRVISTSQRGQSAPSNQVSIYAGSEESSLRVAA